MMEKTGTEGGYIDALLSARQMILIIAVALVSWSALGLLQLHFTIDNRIYFDPRNVERAALEAVEADHGRYSAAVLVVAARSGTVVTPEVLEAIREAEQRLDDIEAVVSISSLLTRAARLTPDGATGAIADARLAERLRALLDHRRGAFDQLISDDDRVTAVTALLRIDPEHPDQQVTDARKIQTLRDRMQVRYPELDWHLTGDAILDATFIDAILRDLVELVPFQVVATIVLLLVSLQSIALTIAVLLILGGAVTVTMGVAGLLGYDLNGVTSATPVILMGLSIATCIHLVFAWQRARREGADTRDALETAIRLNRFPIGLATATTIVSFLCMNFSDSPPFRELGNLVAIGLLVTWLMVFTVLPLLISFFPDEIGGAHVGFERIMSGLGRMTIRLCWLIIPVFFIAAGAATWGITRLEFDDRFAHYFDESFDFRTSTDFYEKHLSGLTVLQFSLPAGKGETVWSRPFLADLERFETWLQQQPHVVAIHGLNGLVKRAARAVPGLDGTSLPPEGMALDQVAGALRAQLAASPTPHLLAAKDGAKALLSVTLRGVTSADIRRFAEEADGWLAANLTERRAPAVGMPLLSAHMSERNANAMVWGTAVALLVVSLMMFFVLSSFRLGIVSLIPNLLPMVMALGFWGLVFAEASFAVTVVSAITFGLVVDGTIHILSKYRYARTRLQLNVEQAIVYGMSTVSMAVLATSVAVASGFAVLALSGFLVNRELGLLSCVVLICALLADILLLPALLAVIDKD